MLQVLLTILKILGILLLVLLGILLFVIVTVLFVPIRYSVTGEKHKENKQDEETQVLKAKVIVSWLAHIVHFRFRLQNQEREENISKGEHSTSDKKSKIKTDMELYVFGIPVFALKNKIATKRQKSKVKSDRTTTTEQMGNTALPSDEIYESVMAEKQVAETTSDIDMDGTEDIVVEELQQSDDFVGQDSSEEEFTSEIDLQSQKKRGNPIKTFFLKMKAIPEKIKATMEKIKLTIKKICGKIRVGSDFLKNESTKATIRLIFGKLKNIIVHILPKNIKGNLMYGFDDPALTGEILGVASLFYPKYQKTLKIIPVFEQSILEGKLQMKGRIVIAYLIWQVVKIVLDKEARLTFQNAKKLVTEIKK